MPDTGASLLPTAIMGLLAAALCNPQNRDLKPTSPCFKPHVRCRYFTEVLKKILDGIPCCPVVKTALSLLRLKVPQSLIGELRSHKPHGTAKKKKKNQNYDKYVLNQGCTFTFGGRVNL